MIRIIGLGSPFGDDDVGWRVVERLRDRLPNAIDLQLLDRPGAALINWFDKVSHLVIVDAVSGYPLPGQVLHLLPADLRSLNRLVSSHQLDLAETLALADTLGRLPEKVEIVGVAIGDPDCCLKVVELGCGQLVQDIVRAFGPADENRPGYKNRATNRNGFAKQRPAGR